MVNDLQILRAALSAMPVPEPRDGFVDRVLAKASGRKSPVKGGFLAAIRRPATWWAAGAGALAATLAWMALFIHTGNAPEPNLVLTLNESRDVPLVIEAERDLDGATIRLSVTGSVELAGYGDQHEIEWTASLTRGANLLSLPVFARTPGDGRVVAVIEHEGRTRRVSLALHVVAPKDDSA